MFMCVCGWCVCKGRKKGREQGQASYCRRVLQHVFSCLSSFAPPFFFFFFFLSLHSLAAWNRLSRFPMFTRLASYIISLYHYRCLSACLGLQGGGERRSEKESEGTWFLGIITWENRTACLRPLRSSSSAFTVITLALSLFLAWLRFASMAGFLSLRVLLRFSFLYLHGLYGLDWTGPARLYRLWTTGYGLSYEFRTALYWLLTTVSELRVTGLRAAGYRLRTTGHKLQTTDYGLGATK
jgi:hypothetical protein